MTPTPQTNFNRYKKYSTDLRKYYRMPAVQTSLSVVMSLFITAFFIFVALRPTFVTITTLKRTITESEETLAKLTKKAAALQKISTASETYNPLIKFVDNSIPQQGPLYQRLTTSLEILAAESRVTLLATNLGDALTYSTIVDPYSGVNRTVISLPLSVQVSGPFPDVNNFFQQLISIDRLVTVESIALGRDAKTNKKTQASTDSLSLTITGQAHYIANKSLLTPLLPSLKDQNPSPSSKQEASDVSEN